MADEANIQPSRQKARDRSFALLVFGVATLLPPIAGVSLIERTIAGIPIPIVYIFAIWLTLILGAALLSKSLLQSEEPISQPDPPRPAD